MIAVIVIASLYTLCLLIYGFAMWRIESGAAGWGSAGKRIG